MKALRTTLGIAVSALAMTVATAVFAQHHGGNGQSGGSRGGGNQGGWHGGGTPGGGWHGGGGTGGWRGGSGHIGGSRGGFVPRSHGFRSYGYYPRYSYPYYWPPVVGYYGPSYYYDYGYPYYDYEYVVPPTVYYQAPQLAQVTPPPPPAPRPAAPPAPAPQPTQTAAATEDISQKIEAIQNDTKGAVAAIQQIGRIIGQINDYHNTIASAVPRSSSSCARISCRQAVSSRGGV